MSNSKTYPHYFKKLPKGTTHVDVYLVLSLYGVTDPAVAHAAKKLLCAGKRGLKEQQVDLAEARDSIIRALEIIGAQESVHCCSDPTCSIPEGIPHGAAARQSWVVQCCDHNALWRTESMRYTHAEATSIMDAQQKNNPHLNYRVHDMAPWGITEATDWYTRLSLVMNVPRKEAKLRWLHYSGGVAPECRPVDVVRAFELILAHETSFPYKPEEHFGDESAPA